MRNCLVQKQTLASRSMSATSRIRRKRLSPRCAHLLSVTVYFLTSALWGRGFLKPRFRDEKTEARRGLKFCSRLLFNKQEASRPGFEPRRPDSWIGLWVSSYCVSWCFWDRSAFIATIPHLSWSLTSPLTSRAPIPTACWGLCLEVLQGHLTQHDPYAFITDFIEHRYLASPPCAGNVLGIRDKVVKTKRRVLLLWVYFLLRWDMGGGGREQK